ncbi:MAG TPA: hypothetical protein PKM25_07715 [Candidatus Ozemobacteraceae bacterium]|nr:hypothetical protein [Candidatus Ozemobacteraceae bacterium]
MSVTSRAFWPNLLGLKGLMADLAGAQWPFTEFLTVQDLKNLKGFVMKSGLLMSGSLPADGFEIPPEILKVTTVLPAVALFLAKQALDDTRSFQTGAIPAARVRVALETRAQNQVVRQFQAEMQRTLWLKALHAAGLSEEQQRAIRESVDRPATEVTSETDERPSHLKLAETFARHYGFEMCQVDDSSPLPGSLSWIAAAVRELQDGQADLVIAGGIDGVHAINALLNRQAESASDLRNVRYCEGLGMIALRRFADAERDGDHIYAIISDVDASSIGFAGREPPLPAELPTTPPAKAGGGRIEQLARFARLSMTDIVEDGNGFCRNLPFNSLPEDGSTNASLDWKRLRDCWVKRTGSHRFFHDLIGALCGAFVSRVVIQNPASFAAVADQPVVFLANHQIGLESPLFMAIAYGLTGLPVQAVAKPDHVNAWLSFLLDFAQDSLGDGHPFRLMYFDRQNPQGLINALKQEGRREASLLVHVEGTRGLTANQPVTRMSSIFLDMTIDKNIPVVPVRFVGGLPLHPIDERLDFPFDNGKQDYLIGKPILPGELKNLPYGQRPKYIMDLINNLGPGKGEDVLLPPCQAFGTKTRFFMETFGFPKMQAMLFAILQLIDEPCKETAQLITSAKSGKLDAASSDIPPVLKKFLGHVKTKFT